jgi:hypothetical protein
VKQSACKEAPLLFGNRTVGARGVEDVHLAKPLDPDETHKYKTRRRSRVGVRIEGRTFYPWEAFPLPAEACATFCI